MFSISKVLPDHEIYHCLFKNHDVMCFALMRILHAEATSATYVLTLERCILDHISKYGKFDYPSKWSGFSIPSECVIEFYHNYQNSLGEAEQIFFKKLAKKIPHWQDGIYSLIASKSSYNILNHEIAHGLYYTCDEYEKGMNDLLRQTTCRRKLKTQLGRLGYHHSCVDDEIQAYLATSSDLALYDIFKVGKIAEYAQPFKRLFRSYRYGY